MQAGNGFTTPFGRRPLSLAMLASQIEAFAIEPKVSIDKWKMFRSICDARPRLGLTDRALLVLNALLTFYPQSELSAEHGLIVFPSNASLSQRAHGMAPATLRRHLAALVGSGLIVRKDSANGKRFSRKVRTGRTGSDGDNSQNEAFGFSLAPLIARAGEIEALADEMREEKQRIRMLRHRLTLVRRDLSKLIALGRAELPDQDWDTSDRLFAAALHTVLPRDGAPALQCALETLERLHLNVSKSLENKLISRNMSANESRFERHKQSSNPNCDSGLEPGSRESKGSPPADVAPTMPDELERDERPVPLPVVLKACPDMAGYAKHGIATWRDLMSTAVLVRSMLGVSPSAYEEACAVLGQERAAVVMACILQRAAHIKSAGGYLRSLTEKARNASFSLWPMLMAQLRANGAAC